MFSKVALFVAAAFAASAVASPMIYDSCNSGPVMCCGSLNAPGTAGANYALGLIDVVVTGLTGQIGAQCNPITVIGAGTGANCASAPVCCEQNFFNQLVGVNCSPIVAGV
ncbi:hypothetical protein GALMADRAFT_256918 [Galerina marginata CBS 339.88]|uniref:Hydrophobin n=1 Tax=Galerina marginata (strain CBS 339.88) TaxID=685588 RepID=A0A067SLP6_GALM3|nr:hypothetical protein GALMADRAFT_256918 [Galerina marginata CBS 339.88]